MKAPSARMLGSRTLRATLYGLDRQTVVAQIEVAPPVPKQVAHNGAFFTRAHRLPSGWAYEQMR